MFKQNQLYIIRCYSTKNDKPIDYLHNKYGTVKVGNTKHHPPIIRVWNNSVYNFYKNGQDNSLSKYNKLNKLIKSYFNLHNDMKLARSKRMRYQRIKTISKKLFISRPEVKQTNDKITITVYYFDKLKHSFIRKIFFFNRPNIVKFIQNRKYRKRIFARKIKLLEKRIKYSGMKQIINLKAFKDRNKFKNKYLEQSLWLYFFKYLLSLINIQVYNPINISNSLISKNRNEYLKLLIKKENLNINHIINSNPKLLFWIDLNNYSFEKIENKDINYIYLMTKAINYYNFAMINRNTENNYLTRLNFISQTNKKLIGIINIFTATGIISNSLLLKAYNYMTFKVYKGFSRKIYNKRYNKISKLTHLSMANIIKFKKLLPALKILIDSYYNKRTELNMVNLKYFYLNSEIYTQALITKLKKKISPLKVIKKSLNKVKVFYTHYNKKQVILNNINDIFKDVNISMDSISRNFLQNEKDDTSESKLDGLQKIFEKIFPHNLLQKYDRLKARFRKKVSNILNTVKYKGILGIRIEAKGRLTRRHKAARSVSHLVYKGNLKDSDSYFYEREDYSKNIPTVLMRNDVRANTQHFCKSSVRRIGSFGIKTWISGK